MPFQKITNEQLQTLKEKYINSPNKNLIDLSQEKMAEANMGFLSGEERSATQVLTQHTVKEADEILKLHTRQKYKNLFTKEKLFEIPLDVTESAPKGWMSFFSKKPDQIKPAPQEKITNNKTPFKPR